MKTLDESVAAAMDGRDASIVPFLPYILQDTCELGTSSGVVIDDILKRFKDRFDVVVLETKIVCAVFAPRRKGKGRA